MARLKKYTIEHGPYINVSHIESRREKWVVVMEDPDAKHMEIVCVCYHKHYAQRIHELFSELELEK